MKFEVLGEDPEPKKSSIPQKRVVHIVVVCLVAIAIVLLGFGVASLVPTGQASQDENAERQKLALQEMYSSSGITLEESDFVTTTDENGDVVVDVVDSKKAELEAMKSQLLASIASSNSNFASLPTATPQAKDNTPEANDEPTQEDNDVNIEKQILDAISTQMSRVNSFMSSSLSESENQYYYEAFNNIISSARDGNPSPSADYDMHYGYTYSDAYSCLCGYAFASCVMGDDGDAIWTNSFLTSFDATTLSSCIKNGKYDDGYSSITSIVEEEKEFSYNSTTIKSAYAVYCGDSKVYITYDFLVLDVE